MELAVMGFISQFTVVGIAEILEWLACVIKSKCKFHNVIQYLVCLLVIVHNVCIFYTVKWSLVWGLLVEFLSLFQSWY